MSSGFDGHARPNTTDWGEHSAVADLSTGRRFKAVQDVPMQVQATTSGDYTYYGFSNFGVNATQPYWRILRINASGDPHLTAADGNDEFDNILTNMDSYTYS